MIHNLRGPQGFNHMMKLLLSLVQAMMHRHNMIDLVGDITMWEDALVSH
jgi:hypothetical protein